MDRIKEETSDSDNEVVYQKAKEFFGGKKELRPKKPAGKKGKKVKVSDSEEEI